MITLDLQFFGGRGAASSSGGAGDIGAQLSAINASAQRVAEIMDKYTVLGNTKTNLDGTVTLADGTKMTKAEHDKAVNSLLKEYHKEIDTQKKLGVTTQTGEIKIKGATPKQSATVSRINANIMGNSSVKNPKWSRNKDGEIVLTYDLVLPNTNARGKTTVNILKNGKVTYHST